MKRSIFFSITFIFLIAFLGVLGSFYLFLKYEKASETGAVEKKFEFISKTLPWKLQNLQNPNKIVKELKDLGLEPITYVKEAIKIIKESKKIKKISTPYGDIWLLKHNNSYYIFIQSFGNSLLLKDISQNFYKNIFIYSLFSTVLIMLLFAYIGVIFKLKPLKKIENELKKFSKGSLDLDLDIKGSSEITKVAESLKESIEGMKNILNSRRLLLRNIMHELKTPIAKGRIVAEMIKEQKQKDRLINIFERLNSLINEIAAIEEVNSKIKPKFEKIKISDILEEAIKLGMFEKDNIKITYIKNPEISADPKLFGIAVKNLIENGIKYSEDNKIEIVVKEDKVEFKNRGKPLKYDLKHYLEPFAKDQNSSGFGLGLYLVDSILKIHNFTLSYRNNDNFLIFCINF